jgi:hypothetical protein
VDGEHVISKLVDIKDKKEEKDGGSSREDVWKVMCRDLSLTKPFDPLRHYEEKMIVSLIIPETLLGKTHSSQYVTERYINDLSTAQYEEFTSLRGIFHLLNSLARSERSGGGFLKDVQLFEETFANWDDYTNEQKLESVKIGWIVGEFIFFFFQK